MVVLGLDTMYRISMSSIFGLIDVDISNDTPIFETSLPQALRFLSLSDINVLLPQTSRCCSNLLILSVDVSVDVFVIFVLLQSTVVLVRQAVVVS